LISNRESKAQIIFGIAARLKPCPDTKHFSAVCEGVPFLEVFSAQRKPCRAPVQSS
jgi:hypothetical protein